ncbi:two-component sensor histidine kinase [Nostocoides sp. F2B08]|nr:two-component sensor histidine kinase [Tetrasphaera sp. F2B08]
MSRRRGAAAGAGVSRSDDVATDAGSGADPVSRTLPPGAGAVLSVLSSTTIVVDPSDLVLSASPSASAYGLVRRNVLVHDEIKRLVREVREQRVIREETLRIGRGLSEPGDDGEPLVMVVRVAPLDEHHVVILIQDRTHEQRVEQVRRDFVANVGHELKTPVGGLSLLAEAVLDAKDDPAAVERFASRMQVESRRLGRLVTDIVDLTRLQAADSLHEPRRVDIATVVREAVDSTAVAAESRDIAIDTVVEPGLTTFGDEDLLVTAVRNLVSNAVNYSEPGTRVAVRAARRGETVEVVVADHGRGIPLAEQDRIFERFYRIDPARSRATGGTGLGLAIVKHVCSTHGGTVSVWSQEGKGATFTIRLPLHTGPDDDGGEVDPEDDGSAESADLGTISRAARNPPTDARGRPEIPSTTSDQGARTA